jgi:hypothetical protein
LTIKAVSTADATVSDTATVTVTAATSSANIILSITDTGKNLTFTKNSAPFNGGSLGTISKTGGTKTMTVGVAAQTGYTYEWVINGAYATKRTGTSITLNAADFTLGTFTLTLIAIDGGNVKWSSDKLMSFTVEK